METEKPDLVAVLEYYAQQQGHDLDLTRVSEYGRRNIKCPFHDDRTPSAVIDLGTGRFRCFACNAPSGDSIDIIRGMEGVEFIEAIRWAADHLGFEGGEVRRTPTARQYKPSWLTDDDD